RGGGGGWGGGWDYSPGGALVKDTSRDPRPQGLGGGSAVGGGLAAVPSAGSPCGLRTARSVRCDEGLAAARQAANGASRGGAGRCAGGLSGGRAAAGVGCSPPWIAGSTRCNPSPSPKTPRPGSPPGRGATPRRSS